MSRSALLQRVSALPQPSTPILGQNPTPDLSPEPLCCRTLTCTLISLQCAQRSSWAPCPLLKSPSVGKYCQSNNFSPFSSLPHGLFKGRSICTTAHGSPTSPSIWSFLGSSAWPRRCCPGFHAPVGPKTSPRARSAGSAPPAIRSPSSSSSAGLLQVSSSVAGSHVHPGEQSHRRHQAEAYRVRVRG